MRSFACLLEVLLAARLGVVNLRGWLSPVKLLFDEGWSLEGFKAWLRIEVHLLADFSSVLYLLLKWEQAGCSAVT